MEEKIDLQICLGSSCFSRGNKRVVKVIDQYIKDNNLQNLVYFHGCHCFSQCEMGPSMCVNGKYYHQLTEESVESILNDLFGAKNAVL